MFVKKCLSLALCFTLSGPVFGQALPVPVNPKSIVTKIIEDVSSEVSKQTVNLVKSTLEALPGATAGAVTVDLPIMLSLVGLSSLGVISGVPSVIVKPFVTGAFLGSTFRNVCHSYVGNSGPMGIACDAMSGGIKYVSRSVFLGASGEALAHKAVEGAFNVGTYGEMMNELGSAIVNNDIAKAFTIIALIENSSGGIGLIFNLLNHFQEGTSFSASTLKNELKIMALVPVLVTFYVFTLNRYASDYVKSFVSFFTDPIIKGLPNFDEEAELKHEL